VIATEKGQRKEYPPRAGISLRSVVPPEGSAMGELEFVRGSEAAPALAQIINCTWFVWYPIGLFLLLLWAYLDPWATTRPVLDLRLPNLNWPQIDLAHTCGSILISLLGGLLFIALGISLLNWWFNRPRHPIY
jgi:hypothetical protein